MPSLTYQEKSLYGTLAADLIVYVPYFMYVAHHSSTLSRIVGTIVAIASRSRLTDERDRLIEARGYRAGYFALVSGVLAAITLLWLHAMIGFDPNHPAVHFINVLLAMLVLSGLVKTIVQLVSYRIGA